MRMKQRGSYAPYPGRKSVQLRPSAEDPEGQGVTPRRDGDACWCGATGSAAVLYSAGWGFDSLHQLQCTLIVLHLLL